MVHLTTTLTPARLFLEHTLPAQFNAAEDEDSQSDSKSIEAKIWWDVSVPRVIPADDSRPPLHQVWVVDVV